MKNSNTAGQKDYIDSTCTVESSVPVESSVKSYALMAATAVVAVAAIAGTVFFMSKQTSTEA